MEGVNVLFSVAGKTAVITGGTRGIGQAATLALAEGGADPILMIQRDSSNTETLQAVQKLGRRTSIYEADLSSQQAMRDVTSQVIKDGYNVDILVNCGGIQKRHPSAEFPDEDWNEVLQVNLSAVFTLCRDFGAHMLSRPADQFGRRGSIINFASLLSFQGGITVPAYAASKGAVAQLTKALANEWTAQGVNVNAIAPGYIDTDMNTALINDPDRAASISARIPAGRWGTPDDFKGAVLFLSSRASSYVSGHVLVVDGGWMGR